MSLIDPLSRLAALRPARKQEMERASPETCRADADRLCQLLGGAVRRNRYGEHLFLRQWYGAPEMAVPDAHSISLLLPQNASLEDAAIEAACDTGRWLFLDTETTGLAGGTGTYPFLVGLAWWDAGGLQIEQFFMRDLDEEHSVLIELSERMKQRPVLVTFNGKSFDWPLLETRYRMTRAIPPCAPLIHLDLLHPARQLWRLRLGSVRLRELEQHVLAGDHEAPGWSRQDDIDSALIPQIYFEYLRGGAAEPLCGVFRHNQMDLRGLASLAGRVLALLDPLEPPADPFELYGLSRLLNRRGDRNRARQCYEKVLGGGLPKMFERQAQRELAQIAKRERDYRRATALWESLRQPTARAANGAPRALTPPEELQKALEGALEAAEQLAIYYEHEVKQPRRAAEVTRSALGEVQIGQRKGALPAVKARRLETRLLRRLARLQRHL